MNRLYIFLNICLLAFGCQLGAQKVGLVLSGGGAKGYAHIGVLKALEEEQIPIDYIGGTSMGAIVGSLYASGYSAKELEQIVLEIDFNELLINDKEREEIPYFDKVNRDKYILELPFDDFKLQIPNAVSRGQGPANVFSYLFRHVDGNIDFNELPIPFLCIGTNLETGEMKVFRSGSLAKSVMASGAYPTLLNPVEIDGQIYTDGGITNNFPAKEVKELGADILIGVDLNDDLLNREKLESATKILEQIVRYRIVQNTEEQKQFLDFYLEPDLSNYSVIDFDLKREIIQIGYETAKAQLQKIKTKTGTRKKPRPDVGPSVDESVLIENIAIEGLENYNSSYVKGKLGINPPHFTTYNQITEGIERLYSTGNFENVFYELQDGDLGKVLALRFIEIPNKLSAKFSLHYDDLYKTGVLLNLSARRLLVENSQFSADLVLGDNPRYALNYFINNGVYPSFGLHSSYNHFEANSNISGLFVNNLEYDWNEFSNRFYMQSTILDKYAAGVGIEHQYVSIFTNSVDRTSPFRYLENGYFLSPYAYLGADNRDDPNFPSKGILVDSKFKLLWLSNTDDFVSNSFIDARLQLNFPLVNDRLVLQTETEFGTFTDVDASVSQFFTMGGFNQQRFLNTSRFYGLPFGFEAAPNKLLLRAALQVRILDNHYVRGIGNIANFEDGFDLLRFFEYDFTGVALQYGYKSPVGPLQFFWSYSAQTRQALFNFSLGFWF